MSIFIPGGKAGGGGLESFWYDSSIAYPKDAYIYYWDFERPDWVTMYRNKSGADTAPGPFDPLLWERRGSFNDTPWSMEYAQTGLVHGGKVSQTGGPLQYKVEAGNGIIFGAVKTDGTIDTINVSWQETINTADFRLSSTIYLFIDRNGNINTLNNPPPPSSYRSMIYLGVVVQDPLNANQIGGITFAPYANYISQQTMQDLHRRLFTPCMDAGHVDVKPKSLKLSHGILRFYSYTSNWETDVNDPHMQSIQPVDPIQFTEVDSGFNVIRNNVTDIDPTNWEDSGTVKPLPANDKVTIHRLFYSITLQKYFLQVGQNVYDTIGDARESFQSENYNYAKPLTSMANAIIIAYIIIRKDTTTLDDGNKCEVKNGGCSFASGASSAIEYLKDLLDTNIIPPLKTDQHLSFSTTSNVWENKFPNPFVRYYEQKAKNDVVEMDAVYFDDINGEWKKAIADDVTNRKFAQGIAVNIQPLMITPVTPPGSPPATPIASTTNVRIDVVLFGVLTINAHGFDVGSTYYLSDTVPGGVTKTAPTNSRSFKQSIFTVLDNNDLLISSSSESFENNIIKNPLTNQKNVIEPDSDVNPLTIKQIAGAQEDPLTIESSLANYKFSVDGKFIIENSTTSPAIKHSSIETRRNRKTITSPFFNALIMRVHDASGLDSIDFEMHYDEPRPIWNDRKLELNITYFNPAIDYNQGDKVIYPINSAPGTPRYEIWRAINDTPAGAWNKNQWEKVSGNGYSFRGWFDPLDPNGGDDVSFNVINNSNDYSEGDYIISRNTGYYDFTAGQPTFGTAGIEVKEGERIAYMNKNWQIISPITDPVRMKGWFNPQMDLGDISQVEATVKNNSDVYTEGDYIIADRDGRYDFLNGVTGGSTSVTKDVHLGERWRYTNNAWVLASPAAAVPDRVRMKGWFDPADQDGGDDVDFPVFNNSTDYINGDYVISLNDGTYNFVTGRPDTTGTPIKEGERIQYYGGLWGSIDQTVILPKMVGWFDPSQDDGGPDVDEFIHNGGAFKRNDYVVATANGFYNFATGKSSATAGPAYSRIGGGQRWSYDGTNWNAVADAPTLFKGWFDPSQDDGGNRVPDSIQNTTPNYVDGSFIIAEGTGQYDFTNGTSVSAPNGTKVESGQIFRYNGSVWQLIGHQEDPNVIGFFNPTNDGGKGTVLHNIVNGTTDYRNGNYAIALSDGLYDFTTGQTDTGVAVGSPAPSGTRVPGGSRIVYDGTNWSVLSAGSGLSKGFMDPTVNNGGPGVNYPIVNGTIDYNGNEFVIVEKYGRYNFATGRPETLHATEPGLANGTLLRKNDVVIYDGAVWRSITGENTFYQHPMAQPGIENPNDDPDWSTNPDGYTFFITNTRVYKWVEDWTDEMTLGGGLTIPRTPPTWVPIYDTDIPVWDTTKAYRPGDMVLVPPPVGSTVWGMYKVNNAVTGATTIGQSPDATPTEWDQIGGGAVTNIKFDDISTNPNSTAPWNTALNKVADDYLITPDAVYKYVDNVLDVILIQTGVDIRTIDTTDATTMNALGWVETDYALTPNNYVGEFADANAFTTAAMGRSPATPGDWGIIDPVAGSNTAKVAYLNSAAPITPANPWVPVVDYIVGFTDGTKNLELIKYAGTTDITGWQKIMNLGSTASPDRYRSVADNAARIALNDPTDITDGALIHQKDTGKIWLYTNNNWEEYLPEHPNAMSGSPPAPTPGLQRLEYDGSKVIGDQIRWVDDRQSMTSVSNIPDLNDRTIILTTHLKRGKLVFVATTGEIYELINDPDDGTLTNTISDWRLATSGGIAVYNRVADLPTPTAANNIREGNLALVRFHADAVTPLGDVFIARTGTTPGANKWEPIIREIFTKPLKTDPPVPDPMPRDIQVTTENGHKEIKIWDRTAGAWVLVYSEDSVKQWIAAGNLFVGTAEDTGHGTSGAIDLNVMPGENALGANEKGHYWVFVGTAGYTILPNDIGGVTSAIEGQRLNVGDWIQVSEPTTGTFRYTVIPGDLLAKTRGDSLYGLNTWVAGAFESGTLISHQGGIYKANAAILITDPAPDDPTNTKWIKIPISAGVRNVAADNNLPATAPTGEVYLVLNSARARGNPSFYIWDVASVQWIPIGGAGGGVPLNLGGGELIYNVGLPIGSVMMWPLDLPPDGWLICNGNVFDGVKYAVLNQLLGDNHTPDLRGQFIRGAVGPLDNFAKHQWTTGRPRNPFTTNNTGHHHHDYTLQYTGSGNGGTRFAFWDVNEGKTYQTANAGSHTHTITGGGDSETAPDHVYLNFIIKAEDQNLGRRII